MTKSPIPPPLMPGLGNAQSSIVEARKALERGEKAWNKDQIIDAIQSAEFFIDKAKKSLKK